MDIYRKNINHRAEFAREEYERIIKSFTILDNGTLIDQISGYKARKLSQAYIIYCHYLQVFNGSSPYPTAVAKIRVRNNIRINKVRKENKIIANTVNLHKDSILELQKADCNCNTCGYFVRDIEKTNNLNTNDKIVANKIHYGTCSKFNRDIAEIANITLIHTQKCFVHRKDINL